MKRLLSIILCLSLLLGCMTVLAEGNTVSTPRDNITDTDPPVVVKVICKEKKVKPGDTLHVQVKMDDRSAIKFLRVQFYNKAKDVYLSLDMEYDAKTDMFVGERKITKDNVNGSYVCNWIYTSDKYGNTMDLWEGKGIASFTMSGGSKGDFKATVKLKENGKTIKAGGEIHVEVILPYVIENADHVVVWFYRDGGSGGTGYHFYKDSPTVFKGLVYFDTNCISGKYVLTKIEVEDESYNDLASMKVSGLSFTLTGGSNDKTPPTFSSVTMNEKNKKLKPGDTVHISFKVKDQSEIKSVSAYLDDAASVSADDKKANEHIFKQMGGVSFNLTYNESAQKWDGSVQLPKDMANGKYALVLYAWDIVGNYVFKTFDKLTITYNGPDYVNDGMKAFITDCWNAIWGKKPTNADINKYGMPLATGKQRAVNVIKTLMEKSKLTGKAAAEALWQIMQGKVPTDSEKNKTVKALKTSLDYGIDSLNDAVFRKRCTTWEINAGNLGTKAANTQVASVDVDGGHYVLDGNKATLTGVTDKNIKKLVIKDTVKANGKTYKVTKIDGTACIGLMKLTTVTIGKNVTAIGMYAFANCKKLKTITINTTKLKTVGANCFDKIKSNAVFKCPKKQLAKYEKLIRNNGKAPKKAKFQ